MAGRELTVRSRCHRRALAFWASMLLLLAGCGGNIGEPTYSAGGTVRLPDGSPLSAGWVSFRSMDNSRPLNARGEIDAEGNFELSTFELGDGAVAGRHQVVVAAPTRSDRGESPDGPPTPAPLDTKFSSYETSGLEFVVTEDASQNRFQIQVSR